MRSRRASASARALLRWVALLSLLATAALAYVPGAAGAAVPEGDPVCTPGIVSPQCEDADGGGDAQPPGGDDGGGDGSGDPQPQPGAEGQPGTPGGSDGTAPAAPGETTAANEPTGAPDVMSSLAGRSSACAASDLPKWIRDACEGSGSVAHAFPLSHYGLDVASSDKPLHQLRIGDVIAEAPQTFASYSWMLLVYLLNAVLTLLEWTFGLSLIADCGDGSGRACASTMPQVAEAMQDLHHNVLGTPWMLAALAVAGIWAMWNGLVRLRFSETIGGLALTLVLMTAGLVVIANPGGTVGHLAQLGDRVALGLLNAASTRRAENPTATLSQAQKGLFDALVKRPWCALQFGDVDYCLRPRGAPTATVADVWLSFETGSAQRKALYTLTKTGEQVDTGGFAHYRDAWHRFFRHFSPLVPKGKEPGQRNAEANAQALLRRVIGTEPAPEKVQLQEARGTMTRLPLLGLAGIGMLGGIATLAWIGLRLLLATVALLLRLLILPVALLLAALGEPGRKGSLEYVKGTGAALAAKAFYALLLMLFVFISGVLAELDVNWFGRWLLQSGFWWGVLLKRHQLLAFARFDVGDAMSSGGGRQGGGFSPMQAWFGYQALRQAGTDLSNAVSAPWRIARARALQRDEARGGALRPSLARSLGARARSGWQTKQRADRDRALGLFRRKRALEERLANTRRQTGDLQDRLRLGGPASQKLASLQGKRDALLGSQTRNKQAWRDGLAEQAAIRARRAAVTRAHAAAVASGNTAAARVHASELADLARRNGEVARRISDARTSVFAGRSELAGVTADIANTRQDQLLGGGGTARLTPGADSEQVGIKDEIERLKRQERDLEREIAAPEMRWAEGVLARDAAGEQPTEADARRWIEDRRAAIEQGAAPWEDEQLMAAGIQPEDYRSASPAQQASMVARSQAAMEHDRRMLELHDSPSLPVDELRAAADHAERHDPAFAYEAERRHEELREQARRERIIRRRGGR